MKLQLKSLTAVLAFNLVLATGIAQAGILDTFEMDGGSLNSGTGKLDAEDIYNGPIATINQQSFLADQKGANDDIFTSGGSKDINDITQWRHTTGSIPDKNKLSNALMAAYVDSTNGHPMLYMAVDRFINSGSASMGFWFLNEAVELGGSQRFINGDTGGFATHQDGDVLVVVNFQGSTPSVDVYMWSSGSLSLLSSGTNDCRTASNSDAFCASSNNSVEGVPWPYTSKTGSSNHAVDSFMEASIDLEAVLGGNLGCLAAFIAESRSSQQSTAQQKDLAIGGLTGCSLTLNKTASNLSKETDTVTYSFEISNTGFTPLTSVSLIDDVLGDLSSLLAPAGCNFIRGEETCTVTQDWVVPAGFYDTNNPVINNAELIYGPPNGVTTSDTRPSDSHTLWLFKPVLSLAKSAPTESVIGDVTYTFTLENQSEIPAASGLSAPNLVFSTPEAATTGSITDDVIGVLTADATTAGCDNLAVGTPCSFTKVYTIDATTTDPLVNTVNALYHPAGFPNDITATDSHSLDILPTADLAVTKTSSLGGNYTPGQVGSYTISVTNNGPFGVTAASIADTLPLGVTLNGAWTCNATSGSSCPVSGGTAGDQSFSLSADILLNGVITLTVPVIHSENPAAYYP